MGSESGAMFDLPLHEALGIVRPAVFASVGGGGKTTILFALAQEWTDAGGDNLTVLTTTTKMTIPREGRPLPLAIGRDDAFRAGVLDDVHRRGLRSAIVGSGRGDRDRVLEVAPDWPRRAIASHLASLVAVEADGSKSRPFKAPAEHEPVLPDAPDVVAAVIGAGALGRPLDERSVHRPERVAAISGAQLGDPITPQLAAAVLTSPEGGRKHVPETAQFVVLVSSATRNLDAARELAALTDVRTVLWDTTADLLEVWQGGSRSVVS